MNAECQAGATAPGVQTILVVDDSPMVLQFFGVVLRSAGYHVVEAESAHMAMAYLNDGHRVDLLLTDYQMPDTNGVELANWFRKKHPGTPVLLVSGLPVLAQEDSRYDPSVPCRPKSSNPRELTETVASMFPANAR